ncbi:hypothetical protein BGX27_003704 [Mortierella sp. AM989]|nr:hypothetical protein BGX27_003704 [Mortierella sp. AM989]
MKISAISTMFCLAAVAAAANIERSTYDHPYANNLVRRDGPTAVNRHEKQGKGHDEHHVEAHNDGPRKDKNKDKNKDEHKNEDKDSDEDEDEGNNEDEDEVASEEESDGEKKKVDGGEKKNGGSKNDSSKNHGGKNGDAKNDGGKNSDSKNGGGKNGGKDGAKDVDNNKEDSGSKDVAGKDGNSPAGDNGNKVTGEAPNGNKATGEAPKTGTDASIPRDVSSPLWLVQPFGASVWEQGRAYVITWGPNPEPSYAKKLVAKSPVNIRLMQGPPEALREVAVLKNGVDESLHSFQWTVPASITPSKDYAIRISYDNDVDTYSHYFEIVKAGDPRSSKSNVGEPILLPQKGDAPKPLDKGDIIKPATPSNPLPADKANATTPKPAAGAPIAAKPAAHTSAARDTQSANILAFAMTLFGAVYFL